MAEPEYTGSFRKAIFRVGDGPGAPVILKTFLTVTPVQGMHVSVTDLGGNTTKYRVQDVTFAIEEKVTSEDTPRAYYEPTVYVDLVAVV